ncbi:hypothetical protein Q3H58_004073 [Pseudomonas psychrotolerans]|nr:hypothetical protein [Pseudomonas psychrotolerans]
MELTTMMMALGTFVFSLHTLAYSELNRSTAYSHVVTKRVGAQPARQFVGKGEDSITLPGWLAPELAGSPTSLDVLRLMASTGSAWPLIEGSRPDLRPVGDRKPQRDQDDLLLGRHAAAHWLHPHPQAHRRQPGRRIPRDRAGRHQWPAAEAPMISEVLDPATGQLRRTSLRGPNHGDYPQPIYRLRLDGKDISDRLAPRLVSLELTDKRGLEVDELTLTLSDHDGRLPLPPLGGTLQLELGWSNTGLVDKGTYLIAENQPQRCAGSAQAARPQRRPEQEFQDPTRPELQQRHPGRGATHPGRSPGPYRRRGCHPGGETDSPAGSGARVRCQPTDPPRRRIRCRRHGQGRAPAVHAQGPGQDGQRQGPAPYHPQPPGRRSAPVLAHRPQRWRTRLLLRRGSE